MSGQKATSQFPRNQDWKKVETKKGHGRLLEYKSTDKITELSKSIYVDSKLVSYKISILKMNLNRKTITETGWEMKIK